MDYTLEPCTASNIQQLAAISKHTFCEAFEALNNPADFKAYISKAFSLEQLSKELENENSFFYFARGKQGVLGYFKLNVLDAQSDINDPMAAELERIYVLSEFQGRNIGQRMLYDAITIARELNKSYLWLGVWQENGKAIRFYKRNGFEIFGEHPYYIGSDRQMDWLMRILIDPRGD